ncbi:Ribosomal protein S5 2-type fold, subgroup domain-containing protein [Rozella allomycis CSF55]|uniref:Diphosphomevalonate decarboxylase n=1 Tax=Rozella allomycis (strain CSF55) TaxID=988480 RepID=A0A075ATW9_ROZAC|nr:Ribosomal protein S5 2-type fold, subgroup domain-containing protein [Rozella allomycis CSF55]|eukprot:EPZ33708.1 Ribosomal protein S5 2-type fold, subgroup domain-containing protein [Rozella allomycis CSF55]
MKITCQSPVNIAVIKYWGKENVELNLPTNGSISVTLSMEHIKTITCVESNEQIKQDSLVLNGELVEIPGRMKLVIDKMRNIAIRCGNRQIKYKSESPLESPADPRHFITIKSRNTFPTAAGLASSASGYSCLVYCLSLLYHLDAYLTRTELSEFARLGSGSSCRSLFPGLVEWHLGDSSSTSVADSICDSWEDLDILVCIVKSEKKKVGSTVGMQQTVKSSALFKHRVEGMPAKLETMKRAIIAKDFETFANLTMADSNQFHAVCLDTFPPIIYLNEDSRWFIEFVHEYNRMAGETAVAYTFDAGPNPVLYMRSKYTGDVVRLLKQLVDVTKFKSIRDFNECVTIVNELGENIPKTNIPVEIIHAKCGAGPSLCKEEGI